MSASLVIAVDAMGGDSGPAVTIAGATITLQRRPNTSFRFYGDAKAVQASLEKHPALLQRSTVVHAEVSIAMDAKPSQALRQALGQA